MTGLSNDNPFRGNQLIQDTIGEERDDDSQDQGFYGDPENIQEMPLHPAGEDKILDCGFDAEAENKNLEALYDGEGVSPPKFDERQQILEGGVSEAEDAEEEDEEEEEEGLRHNFVSHELVFTPDAVSEAEDRRHMESTIMMQSESGRPNDHRQIFEVDNEEGEEEQEAIAQ